MKTAAAAHASSLVQPEAEEASANAAPVQVESDPTLVHASLTEIDAGTDTPLAETTALTNGHAVEDESTEVATSNIANADVGDEAANAAGESQWDTANGSKDLSMSQEWVQVPRDLAETETGIAATTAAPSNTQSWADEQPEQPASAVPAATPNASTTTAANAAAADPNDGFQQIQRNNRGRGERDGFRGRGGGFRGRGRGGDGRGRGGRGGRGRGGHGAHGSHGSHGGENSGSNVGFHRGPRRNEES